MELNSVELIPQELMENTTKYNFHLNADKQCVVVRIKIAPGIRQCQDKQKPI